MSGPEKPFSCLKTGCGESFTNEDRLAVHAKKHDMELQLGPKGEAFVADQTPTPTRFIRNCEEVGLFQDLQNVNPFEETFKRAIESRTGNPTLNLDSNLTVTNPDDTLHTPHIFPNLSEDNGTNLYSTNDNNSRSHLGVQRSSSDESNNHLSVVRCLTSSVDEGLSQIDDCNKNKKEMGLSNEIRIVKKSFSTSKVKLRRQESIDLPDEINDIPILNNLINGDRLKPENVQNHIERVRENNIEPRNTQIPIISISEINEPNTKDDSNQIKEIKRPSLSHIQSTKSGELECQNLEPKSYLNVESCIKNNYLKLISQKSIEMALANFTNEAQTKSVDLNNISIEDIPETSSIMREQTKVDNISNERVCQVEENQSRQLIFIQNVSTNSKSSEKINNVRSDVTNSVPCKVSNKDNKNVPVIEIDKTIASVDTQKGYELILKWPDGKQIYLKEMNKDNNENPNVDSQRKQPVCETAETNESRNIITNTVKRKLKDMITENSCKKVHTESNASNTSTNHTIFNTFPLQNIVVPDKFIIVPQIIHEPKIPVLSKNNFNLVSVISQPNIAKKDCTLQQTKINSVNSMAQPVIRTVLNGKICDGTTIPISSNDTNNLVSKNNPRVNGNIRKNLIKEQKQETKNKTKDITTTDPNEIKKIGNKEAVVRYRLRNKQRQKQLVDTNEMLTKRNKELNELLALAYAEINSLRNKLGYTVAHNMLDSNQSSLQKK